MDVVAAFVAAIEVHLKPGALDPQGQAVGNGLRALGHQGVRDVRVGKHVRVRLDADNEAAARAEIERMCTELLVNPVMETYAFTLEADQAAAGAAPAAAPRRAQKRRA